MRTFRIGVNIITFYAFIVELCVPLKVTPASVKSVCCVN